MIGESRRAQEVTEGDYPFVIYFPREDMAMAFLDTSDYRTTNPHMGEASYYSIATKNTLLKNMAWSYEAPLPEAAAIKDHIAFYVNNDIAVEQL